MSKAGGCWCSPLNICEVMATAGGEESGPRSVLLLSIPQPLAYARAGRACSAVAELVLSSLLPWRLPYQQLNTWFNTDAVLSVLCCSHFCAVTQV